MGRRRRTAKETIGRAWLPIPSGERLGNRLHEAMYGFADVVLDRTRVWGSYAEQVVAIRDALDELETASRQARFAVETQMKDFGLKTGQEKRRRRHA